MKRKLCAALALLLCLSLGLILAPGAFAVGEDSYAIRFYNEKNYDLVGLTVFGADGNEIAPAETGDGYVYLLAPGTYSYVYHDDRGIFVDIEETGFTVDRAGLEIPVILTVSFAENYYSIWNGAPLSEGGADEATIRAAMPTREEVLDRLADALLEKAGGDAPFFSLSDSDVFNSDANDASSAVSQVRAALVNREPTVQISFSSTVEWSEADFDNAYYDTLCAAVAHTGNHREGDTLKKLLSGIGGSFGGLFDGTTYEYQITYTLLYKTDSAQETAVATAVENLVSSLGLEGMSDYEKVSTIHEWLYNNVNYDWEHYQDPTYKIQFTDYAALIGRKAVCQGIATAYYRLCLASGVDARFITSRVLNHGWNIVKVDGKYYEVDATWDSNIREKHYAYPLPNYFLRGTEWWLSGHKNQAGYSTIGDELDTNSYTLYDSNSLDLILLQDQYPVFETYIVSDADYDPASVPTGLAINETNFPDSVFRAYVSANFDTTPDGYLSDEEIAAVASIDCSGTNEAPGSIASLKGVEHFTALETLNCYNNKLTSIDLSSNSKLWALNCSDNQLQQLGIGSNTLLKYLFCARNQIASLNVKNRTSLMYVDCSGNPIGTLDLTGCSELSSLTCNNCGLRSLNVRICPKIGMVECMSNALTSLDVSGCDKLLYLNCFDNAMTSLNLAGCTALQELECSGNSLPNLDLSSCVSLHRLSCFGNPLTALDITPCPVLVYTRFAAEPVVNEGVITYYDSNYGNTISCDETDDLIINGLLKLPAGTTEIEEEAFAGGAFIYVSLAEGTVSVGPRAFANCPNLSFIYIPAQTAVDATAFEGSDNVYIYRAGTDAAVPAFQVMS